MDIIPGINLEVTAFGVIIFLLGYIWGFSKGGEEPKLRGFKVGSLVLLGFLLLRGIYLILEEIVKTGKLFM
ncbi:MAG: hypothetical protein SFU98_09310 [Leptospiraceae bacterium]|nr:hypothetical protein [Leptospiraceae bacterium]